MHAYFWVNRTNNMWKLYINGVFMEQGTVTNQATAYSSSPEMTQDWDLELGGLRNNSGVMSNNFKGDIAAFAIHQGPVLQDARILEHFNAMSVV